MRIDKMIIEEATRNKRFHLAYIITIALTIRSSAWKSKLVCGQLLQETEESNDGWETVGKKPSRLQKVM